MAFQSFILAGANSTGYSLVNQPPINAGQAVFTASLKCVSGEYFVQPLATATVSVSGVNAGVTNPVTTPIMSGWLHLQAGDVATLGTDRLSDDHTPTDPIAQFNVFVVTGGELQVSQH